MGYIAATVLCIMDNKGKEVYFESQTDAVSFEAGMKLKKDNPDWVMKTEDWGYVYRSFEGWLKSPSGFWKDYEIFLAMAATGGVTGLLWIVAAAIELHKFSQMRWTRAACVSSLRD